MTPRLATLETRRGNADVPREATCDPSSARGRPHVGCAGFERFDGRARGSFRLQKSSSGTWPSGAARVNNLRTHLGSSPPRASERGERGPEAHRAAAKLPNGWRAPLKRSTRRRKAPRAEEAALVDARAGGAVLATSKIKGQPMISGLLASSPQHGSKRRQGVSEIGSPTSRAVDNAAVRVRRHLRRTSLSSERDARR